MTDPKVVLLIFDLYLNDYLNFSKFSRSQLLSLDHNPASQTRTVVRVERANGAIWQSTSGIS